MFSIFLYFCGFLSVHEIDFVQLYRDCWHYFYSSVLLSQVRERARPAVAANNFASSSLDTHTHNYCMCFKSKNHLLSIPIRDMECIKLRMPLIIAKTMWLIHSHWLCVHVALFLFIISTQMRIDGQLYTSNISDTSKRVLYTYFERKLSIIDKHGQACCVDISSLI